MSSVICTNEREQHPDDLERVDGKTAQWSLSVGWFKLKIFKKGVHGGNAAEFG